MDNSAATYIANITRHICMNNMETPTEISTSPHVIDNVTSIVHKTVSTLKMGAISAFFNILSPSLLRLPMFHLIYHSISGPNSLAELGVTISILQMGKAEAQRVRWHVQVSQSKKQSSAPGPFVSRARVLCPYHSVSMHGKQTDYSPEVCRENGSPTMSPPSTRPSVPKICYFPTERRSPKRPTSTQEATPIPGGFLLPQ